MNAHGDYEHLLGAESEIITTTKKSTYVSVLRLKDDRAKCS